MTRRVVSAAIVGAVIAVTLSFPEESPAPARESVPPCVAEDSPGPCVWDATARGNGGGLSFTRDRDGSMTYVDSPGWERFRDVDGHTGCWIMVGPTSTVMCADGFRARS